MGGYVCKLHEKQLGYHQSETWPVIHLSWNECTHLELNQSFRRGKRRKHRWGDGLRGWNPRESRSANTFLQTPCEITLHQLVGCHSGHPGKLDTYPRVWARSCAHVTRHWRDGDGAVDREYLPTLPPVNARFECNYGPVSCGVPCPLLAAIFTPYLLSRTCQDLLLHLRCCSLSTCWARLGKVGHKVCSLISVRPGSNNVIPCSPNVALIQRHWVGLCRGPAPERTETNSHTLYAQTQYRFCYSNSCLLQTDAYYTMTTDMGII